MDGVYYDAMGNLIGIEEKEVSKMTKEQAVHDLNVIKEFFEEKSGATPMCIEYAIEELQEQKHIDEFAKEVHRNSVEHGWWDSERELPEIIALCHSELSEALEAYRNGEDMIWINDGKPDGIGVEMCDCIIRILDYLAYKGFDIGHALKMKHLYNTTRPYKHGGKRI